MAENKNSWNSYYNRLHLSVPLGKPRVFAKVYISARKTRTFLMTAP
jgi:hypothetical protein